MEHVLTNEEILVGVLARYGAQVVDDAIAYLKTRPGTNILQGVPGRKLQTSAVTTRIKFSNTNSICSI